MATGETNGSGWQAGRDMGPQYEIVAAFIGLVIAANVVEMFRHHTHSAARWAMCATLLSAGVGYIVETPAVYLGIDRELGLPNVSILLNYAGFLVCATVIHIWINSWPAIAASASIRTVAVAGTLALAVDVGLFACGRYPVEHPTDFAATYIHQAACVAFVAWDVVAFTILWGWAVVRVRNGRVEARKGNLPWLAAGLGWLQVGMAGACVCSVITVVVPIGAAAGFTPANTHLLIVFESLVEAISGISACLGFSCRLWGPAWSRYASARFPGTVARGRFRQLDALHNLVLAGDENYSAQTGFRMLYRDPATALAYRVCAIIEARDKLAGYRNEEREAEAARWGEALADVIRLSSATEAQRVGSRVPDVDTRETLRPDDLQEATERYLRMARALAMLESTNAVPR